MRVACCSVVGSRPSSDFRDRSLADFGAGWCYGWLTDGAPGRTACLGVTVKVRLIPSVA
jgi:hypothetical protein